MKREAIRFDLLTLIEWTAAIAFLCALLVGAGGMTTWTTEFSSLPPDDSMLRQWLEEHGHDNVRVVREEKKNAIRLEADVSVVEALSVSFVSIPKPPWQELGYPAVLRMGGSSSWTTFSGSPYLWILGFGILILLGVMRRGYARKHLKKTNRREAQL